jgi:bifunctional DNase/RNase
MPVEMRIQGLMIDPITGGPLLVLRDPRTEAKLPIWVGAFEANAIATELERIKMPRPSTHDLLRDVLQRLSARLTKVVVTDLQENIFFALLHLETPSGPLTIDSRPSDAIAIALRCDAPIFATEEVIRAAETIDLTQGHQDTERFRAWLEGLDEGDLGKYPV